LRDRLHPLDVECAVGLTHLQLDAADAALAPSGGILQQLVQRCVQKPA
jgi:hypothetical protein